MTKKKHCNIPDCATCIREAVEKKQAKAVLEGRLPRIGDYYEFSKGVPKITELNIDVVCELWNSGEGMIRNPIKGRF